MSEKFVCIDSLQKNWPMKKIEFSATVERGEALSILGPSGCGKSTILRMIAGLLPSDGGRIVLDGRDVTLVSPWKRGVGMVFQDHALFPHLSVEQNICYGLVSLGVKKKERHRIASQWLERFELEGFNKRAIGTLSGGEKQRVALIRSLVINPLLMLFDEPLSALDTPLRKRLRMDLRARQKDLGYTALYVTHDEQEANVLADRVLRMDRGSSDF